MIYQKMRLRHIEKGALTLAFAEVKFQIVRDSWSPRLFWNSTLASYFYLYFYLMVYTMGNCMLFLLWIRMSFGTIKLWSLRIRWTFHLLIHALKCVRHNPYDSCILYIIVEVCTSLLIFLSLNDLSINIPSFFWIRLVLNQSIYRTIWSVFCQRANSLYINMRSKFLCWRFWEGTIFCHLLR
jgi:hypothetical protein